MRPLTSARSVAACSNATWFGGRRAALLDRAYVPARVRAARGSRRGARLSRRDRAQRARGRHVGSLLRHLRPPQPGGHPQDGRAQPPTGGSDHRDPGAGPLPLLLRTGDHMRHRTFLILPAALVALLVAAPVAAAKKTYKYSSTVRSAPVSTSNGYPNVGGSAVFA